MIAQNDRTKCQRQRSMMVECYRHELLLSSFVFLLLVDNFAPFNVDAATVHDRILINANLFSRPARKLWAYKVLPKRLFANSWWGKCHLDTFSIEQAVGELDKLPVFESLDIEACGRVASVPRIINGSIAERATFKFTAALMRKTESDATLICGSTILSTKFVLTAAHCLEPFRNKMNELQLSIGEYDLSDKQDKFRKIMQIADSRIHNGYTGANLYHNDIALIRTLGEIQFNEFIGPICLPPIAKRTEFFEEQALVSGWGSTGGKITSTSRILLRTWVPVVSPENCWRELRRNESFFDGYLCAGGNDSSDSCQGDSGGPLIIIDHRSFRVVQIGIVSFSFIPVCGVGKPAIYVKLDQYTPWILANVEAMAGLKQQK